MRSHVRTARPRRLLRTERHAPRAVAVPRAIVRTAIAVPSRRPSPALQPATSWAGFQTDPYQDYGRFLTSEGGVLIVYKDIDQRLRHGLWRAFAWTAATGFETWLLLQYSPVQSEAINAACVLILAALNFFIVVKPVEIYRKVEIRPDCMILEGAEVFWLRFMENGLPAFQKDKEGNQVLCGIYGTRFVEYLTVRQFDELDRMSEVFAAHLQQAMQQLWGPALGLGAPQQGSPSR